MRGIRIERALLLVLLLGSCGERLHWTSHSADDAYSLADVANINATRALARIEELSERRDSDDDGGNISRLQAQLNDLERAHDSLTSTVNNNARNANARYDEYRRHVH